MGDQDPALPRGKEALKASQSPDIILYDRVFQPPADARDYSNYTSPPTTPTPPPRERLELTVERIMQVQEELGEELIELRRSTEGSLAAILFELREMRRAIANGGHTVVELERELKEERSRRKRLEMEHEREMENLYKQLAEAL